MERYGRSSGFVLWLALGIAMGAVTGDMGLWLPLGMALGLLHGRAGREKAKKAAGRQNPAHSRCFCRRLRAAQM